MARGGPRLALGDLTLLVFDRQGDRGHRVVARYGLSGPPPPPIQWRGCRRNPCSLLLTPLGDPAQRFDRSLSVLASETTDVLDDPRPTARVVT